MKLITTDLSDKDLYTLCKDYGKNARRWTRRFAYLLPEVLKRGLHKKYGFQGIYEFAAKLCGMNAEVVGRILSLHKNLEEKPLIWEKLEVFGWTKLRAIAGVVEIETQKFWLDKLERLPHSALVEYVQVWKSNVAVLKKENNENMLFILEDCEPTSVHNKSGDNLINGSNKAENDGALEFVNEEFQEDGDIISATPIARTYKKFKFKLDADTEFRLKNIKKQLEKERGAVTFGETLNYVLKKLEELERPEQKVAGASTEMVTSQATSGNTNSKTPSRHIPIKTQQVVLQKFNHHCGYPGCNEPYDAKHHPLRFCLSPNNENLVPLCKKHHQIVHSGLVENEKQSPENWKLSLQEMPEQLRYYLSQTFTERTDWSARQHMVGEIGKDRPHRIYGVARGNKKPVQKTKSPRRRGLCGLEIRMQEIQELR